MSDQTITYTFNWWLEFVQEHDDSALASKLHLQNERIAKLEGELRDAREALEEIAEGKGRYNTDPLTHASNTVEDMIALAVEALANKQESVAPYGSLDGLLADTEQENTK